MGKDYRSMVEKAGIGRTPQLCQDALVEEIRELLKDKMYNGQTGRERLKVYKQDLPIPEDNDEDADTDASASPYILVQMTGGVIANDNTPQSVDFGINICAYDTGTKREGYQDVANIKEDIIQHFCTRPYFGGMFTVLKPIAWAMQIEDSHPYYCGAINITCTAPAMTQDTELKELL